MNDDNKNLPRFNGKVTAFDEDLVIFPARENLEPVTLGDLTATVVQYMLASIDGKHVVKESQVRQMCRVDDVTWNCILKETNNRLRSSIGLFIVKGQGNLYVCNILPPVQHISSSSDLVDARRGFLHVILAFILMEQHPCSGDYFGKTSSESLWKFLENLGFDSDQPDEILGDVSQLLQQFVKEGWLTIAKDVQSIQGKACVFYEWGGKAVSTVSPQMIYDMFLEISAQPSTMWKSHTEKIADMQYRFYQQFRENIGKRPPGGKGKEADPIQGKKVDDRAENLARKVARTQSQQGTTQIQRRK